MSAELDRIAEIRESLDRMQQVARAVAADGTPTDVADPTGTVRVHLDPAGTITSLVVDADWRERHWPEDLGGVVRDTVRAAEAALLARATATTAEQLRDAPPPATRPMPPATETVSGRLHAILTERATTAADRRAVESAVAVLVTEVLAVVEEVDRRTARQLDARHTGGAAHGVLATVDGAGTLVDVAYDAAWLGGQSAFALSLATTEAIARAREVAATAAAEAERATPIAGLTAQLSDPTALAARLGLAG